ncbi:hypothetical protein DL93DRAFT_2055834 [Clavulina sp. PMI_390]|nr:hypothetical protein DL93DRAFT_2055834 [Clavulina sp. PMI_390]
MLAKGAASAVWKGTTFENRSLSILQNHFSMALDRVGGASDGGIDLQGWWWLPSSERSSASEKPSSTSHPSESGVSRRRIRVLAQCKAYSKKLGPASVREMEGVVFANRASQPLVNGSDTSAPSKGLHDIAALLISESPFTKQAIMRAMSSPVPFLLLHLPERVGDSFKSNGSNSAEDVGSAVWNSALSGQQGLLRGEYETRWVRGAPGSSTHSIKPILWWKGKPLGNWTPSSNNAHDSKP